MLALLAAIAKLCDRVIGVRQQTLLVCWIAPGLRDHAGAVARSDLVLERVDERVERVAIHQSFFDQQGFERLHAQRQVRRDCLVLLTLGQTGCRRRSGGCTGDRNSCPEETTSGSVHQVLVSSLIHTAALSRRPLVCRKRWPIACRLYERDEGSDGDYSCNTP